MVYDGYCEGAGALNCNDQINATRLSAAGYAVLGVSVRGTSCSTGTFDAFTAQESRDGAAAIEWAAQQPWSNGHLGMLGDSFPGITQVGVAALRPPHLDAIAPFQVTTDLYRDVSYPGGITNTGLRRVLGRHRSAQQLLSQRAPAGGRDRRLPLRRRTGGAPCGDADAEHRPPGASAPVRRRLLERARMPGANAARINIPTFGCLTWQDDETSSRGSSYLEKLNRARTWVVASNGYHGQCELGSPRITDQLVAFFDRYVKGAANGFERTPHIQLWHDTTTNSAKENVPSWVTSFNSYKAMPVKPLKLYFRPGGQLALTRPKADAQPDRYAYPGPVLGNENGIVFGQNNLLWKGQEPPGASLPYTTPPLSRDAEFFGSGSANIWMSSTASDTDLQITLTEVRPDGQEVYIARGWLRASHRGGATPRRTPARSCRASPPSRACSCGRSTMSSARDRASACGSMHPRARRAAGRSTSSRTRRSTASTPTRSIRRRSSPGT